MLPIPSFRLSPAVLLLTCAILANPSFAIESVLSESDAMADLKAVQAILVSKCIDCHGADEQNADVRLDQLSTDLVSDPKGAETWHDALGAIQRGEMPPDDADPLTTAERQALAGWISEQLNRLKAARKATGGRVVLRRMNRQEYQNTMVDLLGVELNYTENLPPDSVSEEGFMNNGSALRMSALQLEYYLQAARRGLKSAITEGPAPEPFSHSASESVSDKKKDHWTTRLGRNGRFVARVPEFPDAGAFEIRVKAHAEIPPEAPLPIMQVQFGFRSDVRAPAKIVAVTEVANEESKEFVFRARLEEYPIQSRTQSKYPGMLIWIDNVYQDGKRAPKPVQIKEQVEGKKKPVTRLHYPEDPEFPKIVIEEVSFKAPVFASWPPKHSQDILPRQPDSLSDQRQAASEAIDRFLPRVFRRPIQDQERDLFLSYYDTVRQSEESFVAAMREVFAMALIAPDFLYLAEPSSQQHTITDDQLACRLSYFLWSTMPDPQLFELAKTGQLHRPEVLSEQVQRMLADDRASRFLDSFSKQWLDLAGVDRVAINPEYYPGFDNALKPLLQRETQAFFAEIVRQDLPATQLLVADFTMMNQALAKHYGIDDGPRGTSFQRVSWGPLSSRGGLLGQGAILMANSTGEDSHPIKRAVWIRDRLLDDPPAPPPPDVPDLDQDLPELASLPLKDQLKLHLENDACADCHQALDPWGVALDSFGATGLLREKIIRLNPKDRKKRLQHDVDDAVTLPDGTDVKGIAELRQYLVDQQSKAFARALSKRMLSYALGRSLEFSDEETVEQLTQQFIAADYQISELVRLIVCSDPFQR